MQCNGAEIIVKLLERQGVEIVFGIPGGGNLPIYDALRNSEIRHILTRHEQGAGFMAQGMARSTGRVGVCMATSGPGATNLLTAIADAKLDSVPLVAVTGQVPRPMIGTDAFQEVDTYGLTLPITKHNFLVQSAEDLFDIIPESFRIAASGRPGPVVVDIPKDVQTQVLTLGGWPAPWLPEAPKACDPEDIDRAVAMIERSERPVLYIGGGIMNSGSSESLRALAEKNSIPVASTLMGLGCFPHNHPLFLGMVGMHGARHTNFALEEADLLLAFGVRFDDRATGRAQEFCKQADIIHVDIDHSEIGKIKDSNLGIVGDVGSALRALIPRVGTRDREDWRLRVARLKEAHALPPENPDPLHPVNLLKHISRHVAPDTIITTDVGQHQMWTAQVYPFCSPRTFLTSGGLGTMGFGVPAAIGAGLANPKRKVVCISGDGSFLMNIQELATLAEHNLNVTIVIMNNNHLGLVRQQQELFFGKRIFASRFDSRPDFTAIAKGFGIPSHDLKDSTDPLETINAALETPGPSVVNAPIDCNVNVYPMVPPGAANREMIEGDITHV
ncbi:MAG: biosynthetic-type acetolactate synthase large subunit [Thermodesulfobacteriota bacterium]|nr:biosynthetic-type acetolactate synthase large subunit [Thermodesulfobacteriota bacterium]